MRIYLKNVKGNVYDIKLLPLKHKNIALKERLKSMAYAASLIAVLLMMVWLVKLLADNVAWLH